MKKLLYSIIIFCVFALTANAQTDFLTTPKGALYKNFTRDTANKIKLNDVISINVIQKTDKDSVLASSYTSGQPVKLQVVAPEGVSDIVGANLMYIFATAAVNDSLMIKVPTDSVFKGHDEARPPFFPKGSYLVFSVKIVRAQSLNDAIAERNADLEKVKMAEVESANKYIADNKLVLKTTITGLKYVITKASLKPKPLKGDTVMVNYDGKLLNGKVFDSNISNIAKQAGIDQPGRPYEPFPVVVGKGDVIPGWDEGLLLLNEGSKATFIVPSSLAYADKGNEVIPPYSTLVFDVEIVSVKRIKHTPGPVPPKKAVLRKHHAVIKKTIAN